MSLSFSVCLFVCNEPMAWSWSGVGVLGMGTTGLFGGL